MPPNSSALEKTLAKFLLVIAAPYLRGGRLYAGMTKYQA